MAQSAPTSARVVVRRFSTYRDAKLAFDRLRVARIPDRRMSVTARGLRWRAAFTAERSAAIGAMLGAAIAAGLAVLLWSVGGLDPAFTWLGAGVAGGCFGGAAGFALALAAWGVTRHRRGIPETGHVDVERYELLVETRHAERARALLEG